MKESGRESPFQKSPGNDLETGFQEPVKSIPEQDPAQLQKKIKELEKQILLLEYSVLDRIDENHELTVLIKQRENSLSWKLGQRFGGIIPPDSHLTSWISKILIRTMRISQKNRSKTHDPDLERKARLQTELVRILNDNSENCKGIILYPPNHDWGFPLFQRSQQLALALSELGYLFFFSTASNNFDKVSGFQKINNRCYLTDQFPFLVEELPRFYCLFPSTNTMLTLGDIQKFKGKSIIMYDYIDEISEKITLGHPIEHLRRRHEYMLRAADIILATADNLFNESFKKRGGDVFFNTNGVDYDHFHQTRNQNSIPSDMQRVLVKEKPVIGYFGAFATWFDYELVCALAKNRPQYEIVLIGWDYDGTVNDQGFDLYPNIHYLGAKNYSVLPEYAIWFDVSMIPFKINEITKATSPVKLFEYMALGNPIVTTEMAECMKYQSVLIGRTHEEFILKIDLALEYRQNREYLELLDKEARGNTWASRAAAFDRIISSADYKKKYDSLVRRNDQINSL